MSYVMNINSWKQCKVCYNSLVDPNHFPDHGFTRVSNHNPVQCTQFLMKQRVCREYISYAPVKEIDDAEERIYSEVKWSDWSWNEWVG